MQFHEIEKSLLYVAKELQGKLSDDKLSFFELFVKNSEVGLGIEILLEQLYEDEIKISKKSYDILENIIKKTCNNFMDDLKMIKYDE